MEIVQAANLALRFILELCLLAAFGYWGFKTGQSTIVKIALGIGVPLLVAAVWAFFLAPASKTRLQEPWLLIVELILFGSAVAALYSLGQRNVAWAFALVYLLNRILMYIWKQ